MELIWFLYFIAFYETFYLYLFLWSFCFWLLCFLCSFFVQWAFYSGHFSRIILRQNEFRFRSFHRIFFKQRFYHAVELITVELNVLRICRHDTLPKGDNVLTLKRMWKWSNDVHHTSQPPDVRFEVILFILDYFRCQIKRSPNSAVEPHIIFYDFRHSKIANLDSPCSTSKLPFYPMKIFNVLKSLWTIFFPCKYCKASRSWRPISHTSSSE